MIRIRLAHGDRSVELTADLNDSTHVVQCRNIARELWAVVIATGPPTPPDPDPPRVEAGGMGFSADLADQRTYPRTAPDLVPAVPGDPQWDPEDDSARFWRKQDAISRALHGDHADARGLDLIDVGPWPIHLPASDCTMA